VAAVAECISEGNVLVTGVESLPSLGLVVAAGMMAVVVEMIVVDEHAGGYSPQGTIRYCVRVLAF
jgi:hypothetical protein